MPYVHELPAWPAFTWDQNELASRLAAVRHRQGLLIGRMEGQGIIQRSEAMLATLTLDVLKSSEIEGEILNAEQVRSSIARRLGMDIVDAVPVSRDVEGVVEMMLDATQKYSQPLTVERLFRWHASLFPSQPIAAHPIIVGGWRNDANGPMQVVSGPVGRERVHFEAPPARQLDREMEAFIAWIDAPDDTDPVLRAAIAHLWFVTIHPFDDGNGRIARAIADWALARSEGSAQRFYSMSAQIRAERDAYYKILEQTQKGTLDITAWMAWFLACLDRAIEGTEKTLFDVLRKGRFWETHGKVKFNGRQTLMLNRLMEGFEGKLTSTKWAKIAKCSQDTAQRDIQGLMDQGILVKDPAGGRSTSYSLAA